MLYPRVTLPPVVIRLARTLRIEKKNLLNKIKARSVLSKNLVVPHIRMMKYAQVVVALQCECVLGQGLGGSVRHLVSRIDPSEGDIVVVDALPKPVDFVVPVFNAIGDTVVEHNPD